MKKILFCLLFIHFAPNMQAEVQKLHIIQKSGNYVSIPIIEQPKIVFDSGVMYIGNESFLVSNVVKYIVGTDENILGLKNVFKDGLRIDVISVENGNAQIENYKGQTIKLYGTNGVEMPCKVVVDGTSAKVDYSTLPQGIYVLSVGNETIKIQVR